MVSVRFKDEDGPHDSRTTPASAARLAFATAINYSRSVSCNACGVSGMSALAQFDVVLWQDHCGALSEAEQHDVLWSASWDLWRLATQMRDGGPSAQEAACRALISVTGNLGYVRCAHDLRIVEQALLTDDAIDPAQIEGVLDTLCHIGWHLEQRIDALWPQGTCSARAARGAGI